MDFEKVVNRKTLAIKYQRQQDSAIVPSDWSTNTRLSPSRTFQTQRKCLIIAVFTLERDYPYDISIRNRILPERIIHLQWPLSHVIPIFFLKPPVLLYWSATRRSESDLGTCSEIRTSLIRSLIWSTLFTCRQRPGLESLVSGFKVQSSKFTERTDHSVTT